MRVLNRICISQKIKLFSGNFILLIAFSSCSENLNFLVDKNSKENLQIILPEWPPKYGEASSYPHLLEWIVQIEGPEISEQIIISTENIENSKKISIQSFDIVKNQLLSVTAIPVTKGFNEDFCVFFKCAGGIYPQNFQSEKIKKGKLELTWENGFAAEVLRQFFTREYESDFSEEEIFNFISSFNWKKMQLAVLNKTEDSKIKLSEEKSSYFFYNPWLLDSSTILSSIANKNFSLTNLNLKDVQAVSSGEIEQNHKNFLSSYIPENQIISEFHKITLKKNEDNVFSVYNQYGIIIRETSAKNLSTQMFLLPIYNKDYDKN